MSGLTLYYAPGACSQAPHIILHETGLAHSSVAVDLRAKKTADGGDYLAINPKGAVPALALDNGEVLTENAVILQYIGDRAALGDLLPGLGDFRRYRVLEWLNFITTELHKSFGPLFKPDASDETKDFFKKIIGDRLDYVEREMKGPFLMGKNITLPDAYLFVITGWASKFLGLDRWPRLAEFRAMMEQRPSVREVLEVEKRRQAASAG
jgi:glutathione S-transferase